MVFVVGDLGAGPQITNSVAIESDGSQTKFENGSAGRAFHVAAARELSTDELHNTLVEEAIDQIIAFIQGHLDEVPASCREAIEAGMSTLEVST